MMWLWLWLLLILPVDEEARQWRCGAAVEEGPAVKAATNVVVVVVVDFNKNKTLQHAVKTMFTKRMIYSHWLVPLNNISFEPLVVAYRWWSSRNHQRPRRGFDSSVSPSQLSEPHDARHCNFLRERWIHRETEKPTPHKNPIDARRIHCVVVVHRLGRWWERTAFAGLIWGLYLPLLVGVREYIKSGHDRRQDDAARTTHFSGDGKTRNEKIPCGVSITTRVNGIF
jgi:hypothetical protein